MANSNTKRNRNSGYTSRTAALILELYEYWISAGSNINTPIEPMARRWRTGNAQRQAQWARLSFFERLAVYRGVTLRIDPRSADIKKKGKRSHE